MGRRSQGRSLHCWIGRHEWVTRVNAGARWRECGRCGKYLKTGVTANRFPSGGTGETGSFGAGGGL